MGRGATVYVGNLPEGCRSSELEGLFEKYGRISRVDIKGDPSRGALFGFVEFDSSRDAEDAVDARDGYKFDGNRLRVELSKGGGPRASRGSFRGRESPAFFGRGKGYKIEISSLPRDASWQDLRDNFGGVGKILFADVDRRGGGFLEFAYEDDVKRCIDKFDDTKFTSRSGESNYIRLKAGRDSHSQRRSRSCSPARRGRSRSPRRSPVRRGRSRSRSPRRSYSPMRRGRSRSRSYSPARRDRSRSRSITPDRKDRSRSITPRRSLSPARRRSPSPDRKDRGRSRSPDRRRSRSPRRSVSPAHSRSRSHSPIKKDRSRRSASPSGDNRKRSRSPLSNASRSRNRSIDSRSPPPSKKPRSASNSPCGSVSPQRDSQRG